MALWAGLSLLFEASAAAVTCSVPADRPTVQQAIADPSCTVILLGGQTYVESVTISRDLTLKGSSLSTSTIQGTVTVEGSDTETLMADLRIDTSVPQLAGCDSLSVLGEAQLQVLGVDIRSAPGECPPPSDIFSDGFESGDTSAWSATVP